MFKDSRMCNWLQTMKLQTLFPLRSPRALRLIGNANQSQSYLAPRFIWGLKTRVEKTNPILKGQSERKYLYKRGL